MSRQVNLRRRQRLRYALLGLATVVVVLAVGVVSYRANRGLPLESHYRVFADVTNATRLGVNNPVRIDGVRVGQVEGVTALPAPGDGPTARLELRLDPGSDPLPVDTRVQVRIGSPIGGTYVELTPGRSGQTLAGGDVIGADHATASVQVTDLLDLFDESTRTALRGALEEGGSGLAGRGRSLNLAIQETARLMAPAERSLEVLAAPDTRLDRFVASYEAAVRQVAPVATELGSALANGGRTMGALARNPGALEQVFARLPEAETSAAVALEGLTDPLGRVARLAHRIEDGVELLGPAARRTAQTMVEARRPLRALPPVARDLEGVFAQAAELARRPGTSGLLRQVGALADPLDRLFTRVTPAQVHCNIYGVFTENVVSVLGGTGTRENSFELISVSTLGATNELFQNKTISPDLSLNPTPHLNKQECEAGNEPYDRNHARIGNVPGRQYDSWRETEQPEGVRRKARRAGLYKSLGRSR